MKKRRNTDPLKQLQELENAFFDEPLYIRKQELPKINKLRATLGLPQVDLQLKTQHTEQAVTQQVTPTQRKIYVPDYTEARQIYAAYLQRLDVLRPYQAYANQILRDITARPPGGGGTTPIAPLAFGNKGGPIVCDLCGGEFIVEGALQGKTAAEAMEIWVNMPASTDKDTGEPVPCFMYISGGLVFLKEPNETVRFYHDYGPPCWSQVQKEDERARKEHHAKRSASEEGRVKKLLVEYFMGELGRSETEARAMANSVITVLFGLQYGLGVNGPW